MTMWAGNMRERESERVKDMNTEREVGFEANMTVNIVLVLKSMVYKYVQP